MNPIEITALSTADKRALVDALNATRIPLVLSSAPTSSTEGRKGQIAIWVGSGESMPRYALCVKAESGVYTWRNQDLIVTSETAPSEARFPGLLWVRPSTGAISVRNSANTAWNTLSAPTVPDAYDFGDLSGTVTLDRANGEVQHGFISDDTTFEAPDSAFAGARLTIAIDYTVGTPDVDFNGIDMKPEALALLPLTLEAEKAYQFELSYLGGGWVLTATSGPFTQAFNAAIAGIPAQPFNNYYATTAPGSTNDSSEGYSVGSKWYDSVTTQTWVCADASVGEAEWTDATLTADELGSAAFSDSTDFAPALGTDDNYVTDAEKTALGNLGTASASDVEDFATAAQGTLADSSLQPVAVDYRGEYNNGDSTYGIGAVVLYNDLLYVKISNPNNPGYPPFGADWELFEPLIGSPAYDLWAQALLASKADNQDLADYLPLAGGIMDENATIGWDNAAAIREAGAQGLEIECSAGYKWQWVAGRMILRQVNSGQIARIIAIDEINPAATDDETQGFVPGTRWETVDGTMYVCSDATTDNAVWEIGGFVPYTGAAADLDLTGYNLEFSSSNSWYDGSTIGHNAYTAIDLANRQLIANDGSTVMMDWSNSTAGVSLTYGIPLNVDIIFDAGSPSNYIDMVNGEIGGHVYSRTPSINWTNRQLIDSSGDAVLDWDNPYGNIEVFASIQMMGSGGDGFIIDPWGNPSIYPSDRYLYGSTGSDKSIDWGYRQLIGTDGSTVKLEWDDAADGVRIPSKIYTPALGDYSGGAGFTAVKLNERQLIADDGTTVMLDWSGPSLGLDAYAINTAIGYTTQGGAAVFLSGFDAGSNSGVVGSLLAGTDLSQALSVDNRQLIAPDGTTVALDWSSGIPVVPSATLTPNTVAALTGGEGTIAYVNDADTPAIGSAVVAGASAKCLVCYNGTAWIVTSLL